MGKSTISTGPFSIGKSTMESGPNVFSWLVVYLPLWKILISWDDDIPNWMERYTKCSKDGKLINKTWEFFRMQTAFKKPGRFIAVFIWKKHGWRGSQLVSPEVTLFFFRQNTLFSIQNFLENSPNSWIDPIPFHEDIAGYFYKMKWI